MNSLIEISHYTISIFVDRFGTELYNGSEMVSSGKALKNFESIVEIVEIFKSNYRIYFDSDYPPVIGGRGIVIGEFGIDLSCSFPCRDSYENFIYHLLLFVPDPDKVRSSLTYKTYRLNQ